MKTCSRLIAGLLTIAFVLCALLAIGLWNLEHTLLDSEAYKAALRSEQIYTRLPSLLAGQLRYSMTYNPCAEDPTQCEAEPPSGDEPTDAGEAGPPSYFREMDEREWELFLDAALPEAWLRTEAESALDQLFDTLGADAPQPISLSLEGLKRHLTGPGGDQAVRALLQAQPPCTESQLRELAEGGQDDSEMDVYLACRPPEEVLELNREIILDRFHAIVEGWPPTTDLSFGFLRGEAQTRSDEDPQDSGESGAFSAMKAFRLIARWSPLLPVLCLLLVGVFAVRSRADVGRWWGTPLLLTAVAVGGAALAATPLLRWSADVFLRPRIPGGLSPEFVDFLLDVALEMSRGLATRVLLEAAALGMLGIGLHVVARRKHPEPSAVET